MEELTYLTWKNIKITEKGDILINIMRTKTNASRASQDFIVPGEYRGINIATLLEKYKNE